MKQGHFDRVIFSIILGLIFFGIIMVYSASAFYADKLYQDHLYYLKRQAIWLFIGILFGVLAFKLPYEKLLGKTQIFILSSLALLVYMYITNSGRWIHLGFANVQVVDIARFSVILFFADSLTRKEKYLSDFTQGILPHLVYLALFGFLILKQPDFSSAVMLVLLGLVMLAVSPMPLKFLTIPAVIFTPFAVMVALTGYKADRIFGFLHPEKDMLGKGYQIIQSLISLGAGGLSGVGFAQSNQKLFFLPEAHTDFIYSIIGEEWGLIGTTIVLILFFMLMYRGMALAKYATDKFSRYLAFGLTFNFAIYALMNMMIAANLLPPTGLPMPFVSYGGSSMIISCISAGLLLNISNRIYSESNLNNVSFSNRAQKNYNKRGLKFVG